MHHFNSICTCLLYTSGDISFYVGYDSVDVWAERQLFMMSANDTPEYVAAAGPDVYKRQAQAGTWYSFNNIR